jgi:hypothetical protein
VVDDAHDLSFEHLMFIKELTDQGRLQYGHPLGLCLVAAGRGNTIPLKETLDQPDPTWLQFRRRLDKFEPFCPRDAQRASIAEEAGHFLLASAQLTGRIQQHIFASQDVPERFQCQILSFVRIQ